jgi:hypothetical protein
MGDGVSRCNGIKNVDREAARNGRCLALHVSEGSGVAGIWVVGK